ncbi:MAG: carbohydrate ABC transporter permease [Clostridia bacterium]|nr:carbohydrate ABC transporter permease [Clostridia bacterium]
MQNVTSNTKKTKKWRKNRTAKLVAFCILFVVGFIFLLPLVYMVGMSFKTGTDISMNPSKLFPTAEGFTLWNYKQVFKGNGEGASILNSLKNSLIVSGVTVLWAVVVDSLAAYAFTFLKFKNRLAIYAFVIFSMTIPGVIGTTIRYSAFAGMGNSLNVMDEAWYLFMWLIVPGAVDVYHVFLMKNYFDSVPYEIVESARSDGASDFRIFLSIILPLARSTLLLIGMFTFTSSWNNLFWANMVVGSNPEMQTITVYLQGFSSIATQDGLKGLAMAASVVSLIPILIAFVFMQNKMIDGLASTGVKK